MRAADHELSDDSAEALMLRLRDRLDPRAGDALVARYRALALAVARRLLTDRASAEDAVQEAFLRVIRWRRRYRPGKSFSSWFYTILHHVCLDMRRQRARQVRLIQHAASGRPRSSGSEAPDPSGAVDLLAGLAPGDRDVLLLRIVQGLSFQDVAAALGITEEAAKKRAQRALRRLRDQAGLRASRDARALPVPDHT